MKLTSYSADDLVEYRKHSVYRFTDNIWKIVQFYDDRERKGPGPVENRKSYEEKLPASVSRAKRCVLEYALCNPWQYFVTLTISPTHDRSNLDKWLTTFLQWVRDRGKSGNKISYLLVPERHEDGSWHAHGLLYGVPDDDVETFRAMRKRGVKVPTDLVKSGYFNWSPYSKKFGFVSLGKIKNPVAAAFYCTKYVTKDNTRMVNELGWHMYRHSRPLLRPDKLLDLYTRSPEVDRLLTAKYEFCACGFALPRHSLGFADFVALDSSAPDQIDFSYFDPLDDRSAMYEADCYFEFDQMCIDNWSKSFSVASEPF